MAPLTAEEVQKKSPLEAEPALTGVRDPQRPTNEYVLNVAFLSFLLFTCLQLFFALIANSESMMADCAAMYVDVVTYLFNFLAERLKHGHDTSISARALRLRRLYLELIPPSISVVTLMIVTSLALSQAFDTLFAVIDDDGEDAPDLQIMLVFSALNLLLDFVNVSCFARVDQAAGFIGDPHHQHLDHSSSHSATVATETTPLVIKNGKNGNGGVDDNADDDNDDDNDSCDSSELPGGINLNMCSAFTHIAADTLRSIAVLLASGFASLFPSLLSARDADSYGAIVVSGIILVSLGPLVQGLYLTACKIHHLHHTDHHCDSERLPSKEILLGLTV